MKEKINNIKLYYKEHPKRFWVGGIILAAILFMVFSGGSKTSLTIVTATKTDLKQTVLATGQVTSRVDLTLSFPVSGVVSYLPVSVGNKVWKGQVLATLNNRKEYASLSDAKANYQKVSDGNSSAEVAVAQASLDSAKASLNNTQKVQDTLVSSAHRALLNADLTPTLVSGTTNANAPTITGTYNGTESGSYSITPYPTGTNGYFTYAGLETGSRTISTTAPVALGDKGLFIQFPANFYMNPGTVWSVMLPNTKSPNYLAALNAYDNAQKTHDSAISAAQAMVNEAQANLDLKKDKAQPADLAVAQARVDQAQAEYDNTIIYAPESGTIVHVDTKIGENVNPQTQAVVLQDVSNLYVEANVNETNIAKIALHQPVTMTLDAFGPDAKFTGEIVHIDPSSTTSDGVVNYVIKASINPGSFKDSVRPGMNANMIITAWDTPGVITIPKIAVITETNGAESTYFVNVVTNEKKNTYEKRQVKIGKVGDGNLVEVIEGLSEGEKVAIVEAAK